MKPLLITFICLCLLSVVPHAVFAQANIDNTQVINDAVKNNFVPLVGIPYVNTNGAPASFSNYINGFYFAAISIAAFLAVVKIIFAGVKYMLTDVIPTKGKAKTEIRTSLLGLLIVISAVLILKTINPNLTNISLFSTAPMVSVGIGVAKTTSVITSPAQFCKSLTANDTCAVKTCSAAVASCKSDCQKLQGFYTVSGAGRSGGIGNCTYSQNQYDTLMSQRAQQLATTQCPAGQTCNAQPCAKSSLTPIIGSCNTQCLQTRHGIYYDSTSQWCIFTNPQDIVGTSPATVGASYTLVQNADQIAAGEAPQKVTITNTTVINGLITVQLADGSTQQISCGAVKPSICPK